MVHQGVKFVRNFHKEEGKSKKISIQFFSKLRMATAMISCNHIHKSGDVEDYQEEDFEKNSGNFSTEIFCSINEPEASVADIDVPLSFNRNKVRDILRKCRLHLRA